ncbi:MAG: hypothetical protein ABL985_07735 [Casimicrobium sp.]
MIFSNVFAVDLNATVEYDLALYASGFEARSIFVAEHMRPRARKNRVILFAEDTDLLSRPANDAFFKGIFSDDEMTISASGDHEAILLALRSLELTADPNRLIRVFVDYSAMTRTWYGAVLSYFRHVDRTNAVEIDFVYAHGKYQEKFSPMAVTEIVAQPGFAGLASGMRETVALFGLGLDKFASLAVFDRIEPDDAHYFLARPADREGLTEDKVRQENAELITQMSDAPLLLPLEDVGETFRLLCERVTVQDRRKQIVIVPMGPKPHVLASLLVTLRLPRVGCLHVRGWRNPPIQVSALGTSSACRVCFSPDRRA